MLCNFDFRVQTTPGTSTKVVQLLSWSKDQHMRLWTFSSELQQACGITTPKSTASSSSSALSLSGGGPAAPAGSASPFADPHAPLSASAALSIASGIGSDLGIDYEYGALQAEHATKSGLGAKHAPAAASASGTTSQRTLRQEFEMVRKLHLSSVSVEQYDYENRSCVLVKREMYTNKPVLALQITFPDAYPNNVAPVIHVHSAKIALLEKKRIVTVLSQTHTYAHSLARPHTNTTTRACYSYCKELRERKSSAIGRVCSYWWRGSSLSA